MEAALKDRSEIIKLLIDRGENVNKANQQNGFTALLMACQNDHRKAVQLLLGLGADIEAKDNQGFTPLLKACERNNLDLVKCLLASGCNIWAKANDGVCALHVTKSPEIVGELLRHCSSQSAAAATKGISSSVSQSCGASSSANETENDEPGQAGII